MFFHFQPVSFSLEAPPCRSPCPLATDVLSGGGEKGRKVELFCGSAFCSALPRRPSLTFTQIFPLFFFIFALNRAAKKKRRKKGVKEGEKKKINREAQSDPVVSMRHPLKHFFGGEEKASDWWRNETKLFSQSLLILPVQSPQRSGWVGGVAEGGGLGRLGLADT